ncbi:MAG: phytoene desaturase family protein [bacterium]
MFTLKGGIRSLVNAFVKLIQELGGTFYFNSEVEEIIIENRVAKGVKLKNSKTFFADYIVCNSDTPYTYMKLINPKYRSFRNSDIRYKYFTKYSMSLVVIYFAVNKVYKDVPFVHHNIILTKRYKELIYDIFDGRELPEDFSLYIHRPVYTDPSVCKEGYETFYVLSPVPNLKASIDWEKERERYKDKILKFLEENYLPDLRSSIVAIDMIDPIYFRDKLNTYLGSGFSIEPNLMQAAYFRPHNLSEDIKNLYFVGAGTHPGGGVPGVLSSAKIVDTLIEKSKKD